MEQILPLFNLESKKDILKHSKDIVIFQGDLVDTILLANMGLLGLYMHKISYKDYVPPHLHPTKKEKEVMMKNGVGDLRGDARKFVSKICQLFKDRRYLVGHLFYTPDLVRWHFFYFDQRDMDDKSNHWEQGAHIHFVNYLWNYDVKNLWKKFTESREVPGGAVHIRYTKGRRLSAS